MDIISKDQAIDSICINICGKSHNDCGFWKKNFEFCNACKFAFLVGNTPSAEKTGHWENIDIIHDRKDAKITDWQQAKCSVCGKWHTTPYLYCINLDPYCPSCGARMVNDNE